MGGKTHYVVQFLGRVVAKTYCGRYIDAEWVTGNVEEVTCLRCTKGMGITLNDTYNG
jgi:hypothetical protein